MKRQEWFKTCNFPILVESINSGTIYVIYGYIKKDNYYRLHIESNYIVGLASNFQPLTEHSDLAGHLSTILQNLEIWAK